MTGPWKNEPDEIDFTDESTGLPCAMRRGPGGHWCGYVGISENHPWYGKWDSQAVEAPKALVERAVDVNAIGAINLFCGSLNASPDENKWPINLLVSCHGGLTFAGSAHWEDEVRATWWFGFDCAHSGDLCPKYADGDIGRLLFDGSEVYRDVEFVKRALATACADIALATKEGAA